MRKNLATILALVSVLTAAPRAQALSLPSSGSELLRRFGLEVPHEAPGGVPAVNGGPVAVVPDIWETLPKLNYEEAKFVYSRTDRLWGRPELLTRVRRVTPQAGLDLLAEAARGNQTALDLFTDKVFRRDQVFFIPGDVAVSLFRAFLVPGALLAEGVDSATKKPFQIQGIVLGAGHADALYETPLRYSSPPDMPGERASYMVSMRLAQTILGDGHVKIEGLSVMAPIVGPVAITEIEKISSSGNPPMARITTAGFGTVERPVYPIRKR